MARERPDGERIIRFPKAGRDLIGVAQGLMPLLSGPGAERRNAVGVVLVTGPEGGEGSSTVAHNLAHIAAERFGTQICVVQVRGDHADDGPGGGPSGGAAPRPEPALAGSAAPLTGPAPVVILALSRRQLLAAVESDLQGGLTAAAPQARLFIVDTPGLLTSIEAFAVCGQADGVLLVAAAERTTPQQIDAVRATIARAGGTIIGAVLNKRRYRLPAFIARLFGIRSRTDPIVGGAG